MRMFTRSLKAQFIEAFTLLILLLVQRWRPLWSGPLFAMSLCGGLSYVLDFPHLGIATLGPLSSGLAELSWSAVQPALCRHSFEAGTGPMPMIVGSRPAEA